ncbi:MAG: hypothetical protein WB816_03430 [Methylocystis sp.]
MRLNSKLKAACLASVAVVAMLAASEATAGGRGGHGYGQSRAPGHWAAGTSLGAGLGQHWVGPPASGGYNTHAGFNGGGGRNGGGYGGYGGGYGGYNGGYGGYYGGGGVYYGDAGYGYGDAGYGYGYGDQYAAGVPTAYSAATVNAPSFYYNSSAYEHTYQVPTTVYEPAVRTSYVPVTTYQAYRHIVYLPTTRYRTVRRHCNCETNY